MELNNELGRFAVCLPISHEVNLAKMPARLLRVFLGGKLFTDEDGIPDFEGKVGLKVGVGSN